jgi:hypothetical protein
MTHPYFHAADTARVFGGQPEDYLAIHNWLDHAKESFADFRHRAVTHHAEGIAEAERIFGPVVINSDGKPVPVRYVAEQHVRQDCGGRIPSRADWLRQIQPLPWMAQPTRIIGPGAREVRDEL